MKNPPNFIIIGVGKSGTTGLYYSICKHTKIIPSKIKELHFFDHEPTWRKGIKHYENYLGNSKPGYLIGEATPAYMTYSYRVIPRLKKIAPDAKLIVILRNPVTRAYSNLWMHYNWIIDEKLEAVPSWEVYLKNYLDDYPNPPKAKAVYELGHYASILTKWFKEFPRSQFKIVKSEDFFTNHHPVLTDIFKFLGIPDQTINIKNPNKGKYKKINERFVKIFKEHYKPYNQELYKLLGRDFNWENEV